MEYQHPARLPLNPSYSNEDQNTRSVIWCEDHLQLLDQTQLPGEVAYLQLRTSAEVWDAIRQLKVRGAPAIGIAGAFGLYLGVKDWGANRSGDAALLSDLLMEISRQADRLNTSRPTAVNLSWALERLQAAAALAASEAEARIDDIKRALLQEALQLQAEDEETCRMIGVHALTLFQDGMGVLTHCNAGGLATTRYGTALAPFYVAKERGIELKVFADETRPVLQGARLTAFELQQAGIDVTLICDNMAAVVMSKGWVQAVIVGTDRIAANGDVANKIGTYGVAVLAHAHNIPFYVASPLSTIDLNMPDGEHIPIEQRHEDEVTQGFGKRIAPEGVKVFNPAFDVTPHRYVTAIITEKGIIYPPFAERLRELFNS